MVKNTYVFGLLALAICFGAMELFALGGLAYLRSNRGLIYFSTLMSLTGEQRDLLQRVVANKVSHMRLDPELGWSNLPNGLYGNIFSVNADGLRGQIDYGVQPPSGKRRICAFGDSFTFGNEISDADTWENKLAGLLGPRFEVLNFGVGAYGVDQAYLLFREKSRKYRCDLVLIGAISDDINRSVNIYRGFLAGEPFTKPRFKLVGEKLELVPNPLRSAADYENFLRNDRVFIERLAKDDYYARTNYHASNWDLLAIVRLVKVIWREYESKPVHDQTWVRGQCNPLSEAFQVTSKVLAQFYADVAERGAQPVMIFFPYKSELRALLSNGEPPAYTPLKASLAKAGFRIWDAADAFSPSADPAELYAPGGHFNARGTAMVAEFLEKQIRHFPWRVRQVR